MGEVCSLWWRGGGMVKLPRRDCMKEGQSQAHAGDGHREMSIAREEKGDGGEVELVVGWDVAGTGT